VERTWLAWELRRRWRALLGLVLLVACATAVVGAALAGAGRASSAVPRLLEATDPATLNILPNEPGWDWEPVREIPEVAAMATYLVTSTVLIDGRPDLLWLTPDTFEGVEEPVLLEGRLPAPGAVDEVVVTANFPERFGKGVGDTLTLELYQPGSVADAVGASETGGEVPEPDGPVVEATIVGVERSYWTSLVENDYATFLPDGAVRHSPAFGERFADELAGDADETMPYTNAYVRLRGGEADIPEFTERFAEVTGRSDVDMWDMPERHRSTTSSIDFEAWALRALAVVAAVAAAFLVGQAAARMAGGAAAELSALVGAGLTRRGRSRLATSPVLVASSIGAVVGVAVAAVASKWFPVGTAAMYEPDPGFSIAPVTLAAVAVAAVVLPVAAAGATAWFAAGASRSVRPRPSSVTTAVVNSGAPVPIATGTRFALERGVANQAIPVRPTLLAVVAGVAGMVATLTFAAALDDASGTSERWGETWDLVTPIGGGGGWWADPDALRAAYLDVDGVAESVAVRNAVAQVGARKLAVWGFPAEMADRIVITEGRLPRSSEELLLGPTSARNLGVRIGDTVVLAGPDDEMTATVVGLALTPAASHSNYDDSALIGDDGFDVLFAASEPGGRSTIKEAGLLTWVEPGVDTTELAQTLATAGASVGAGIAPFPSEVPGKINALARVGALPQALGVFLAVLGVGAIAHALFSALARRRSELAVLRAIGQTPGQTRLVAFTQAIVIALVGLAVGVPFGIALGRLLWRAVAVATPVAHVEPSWVDAVVLAVPVTLVVVVVLAAWPARRAARLGVTQALRSE
jgi:hypothetical protein